MGECGSHYYLCLAASPAAPHMSHDTLARAVGVAMATAIASQTASMRRIMTNPQIMSLAVSSSWRQPPSPRDEQITSLPRDEQITSLPLRILAMRQAGTFPQCQAAVMDLVTGAPGHRPCDAEPEPKTRGQACAGPSRCKDNMKRWAAFPPAALPPPCRRCLPWRTPQADGRKTFRLNG